MKNRVVLLATALALAGTAGAIDTTIKGGRMELLNQGDQVRFEGGVTLERGNDILRAAEMVTNKTRDKVNVKGDVRLLRRMPNNESWKGYGATGFYDTKSGGGYLQGGKERAHIVHVEVISSTQTRRTDLYAKRFDFKNKGASAVGNGNVYGTVTDPQTGDMYEFWSDRADYDGDSRKIVLSGARQPLVKQTGTGPTRTIRGDTVTYFVEQRRMISEGNAQVVTTEMPSEKGTRP
jgi:lipopolysaccharide export system protein LptA